MAIGYEGDASREKFVVVDVPEGQQVDGKELDRGRQAVL